jgi:hypothetical protein
MMMEKSSFVTNYSDEDKNVLLSSKNKFLKTVKLSRSSGVLDHPNVGLDVSDNDTPNYNILYTGNSA